MLLCGWIVVATKTTIYGRAGVIDRIQNFTIRRVLDKMNRLFVFVESLGVRFGGFIRADKKHRLKAQGNGSRFYGSIPYRRYVFSDFGISARFNNPRIVRVLSISFSHIS